MLDLPAPFYMIKETERKHKKQTLLTKNATIRKEIIRIKEMPHTRVSIVQPKDIDPSNATRQK